MWSSVWDCLMSHHNVPALLVEAEVSTLKYEVLCVL